MIKQWPREEIHKHIQLNVLTLVEQNEVVSRLTLFKIAVPIACKNSFVFSGSWPATIFDGRTDSCPFIIPTT